MDIVFIEGLQIEALIGIYDWERRIRQPLVFDLEMQFDNTIPAASDAIADTLDYKAVSKRLIEFVGESGFGLVETLAERVAAIVLEEFGVERVRLKLSKPGAVRGARAVGVMIERTRQPGAPRRMEATPAAVSTVTAVDPSVRLTAAEVEVAAFAAAVPRGGAAPVVATAQAPNAAPDEGSEAAPVAEASDVVPTMDTPAAGEGVGSVDTSAAMATDAPEVSDADVSNVISASVEADASDATRASGEADAAFLGNASAEQAAEADASAAAHSTADTQPSGSLDATSAADAADMTASAAPAETADTTAAVTDAATRDDANGQSPLEAALLAAVSGWHSPRPTPSGLDAALNALGEKGSRGNGRKSKAAPAAKADAAPAPPPPVSAWQPPALSVDDEIRPPAIEPPPLPEVPAPEEPSEPAPVPAPAAPRANFMRDLDDAPVRPVTVPAGDESMRPVTIAASDEPTPARSVPTPASESGSTPAQPPPLPAQAAKPAVEPVAPPPVTPPAPAATSRAAVAPTVRTAPPPPPRPRNPASDLGRTTRPAYLSLGSNIEPEKNLRSALMALRARFGEVIVSPVYRMTAVGFDGPDFLNAAAIIDSDLDPFALTRWLHGIESAHGRIRSHVKNSSRTLDMDIIFFDDLVLDMPGGLQLPRPELRHAFVLKPLVDIAPGFIDPVRGVPLADVWAAHAERGSKFSTVII